MPADREHAGRDDRPETTTDATGDQGVGGSRTKRLAAGEHAALRSGEGEDGDIDWVHGTSRGSEGNTRGKPTRPPYPNRVFEAPAIGFR